MAERQLYIAAYDVRSSRRLRRTLHILKDFACGGQKSVFECYLHPAERSELLARLQDVLDLDEDRFLIAPVPRHRKVRVLGTAISPADPGFYYVG